MRASLEAKLALLLLFAIATGAMLAAWAARWPFSGSPAAAVVLAASVGIGIAACLARLAVAPTRRVLRALSSAAASLREGDFSSSVVSWQHDELGQLIAVHNELGAALREQHRELTQRELLLETINQSSPTALLVVDPHSRIAYSNGAARHLLNGGIDFVGQDFDALVERLPPAFRNAMAEQEDATFSIPGEESDETYHLSQRRFLLGTRRHRLVLIKRLTRELSRQEVAVWKKLFRALSHELNNSLAPISSLARSGAELAQRGDLRQLPAVFATIGERAQHLHEFIQGYSAFARLPAPRPAPVRWDLLCEVLQGQVEFVLPKPLPDEDGYFDRVQVEQMLINLLRNAQESGTAPGTIELVVTHTGRSQLVEIRDRGCGMSEAVLTQALLPFYSTKRTGSGLGLALAREIAEAHGGHIKLANRDGGGMIVSVLLPLPPG